MLTLMHNFAAQARTASGINILLGIWLLVSPWVFGYHAIPTALFNSVIVGAAIAILAVNRFESPGSKTVLSWVNLALALWTIASPWVYGYASNLGALRDNVVLGIVIGALAIWSGSASTAGHKHSPSAAAH
jgi:hypothetical protein